jgi:hypothetical protein
MIRDEDEAVRLEKESKAVKTADDTEALIADARAKIEEKDGQPWQNVEQFLSDEVLSVIELLEGKE